MAKNDCHLINIGGKRFGSQLVAAVEQGAARFDFLNRDLLGRGLQTVDDVARQRGQPFYPYGLLRALCRLLFPQNYGGRGRKSHGL